MRHLGSLVLFFTGFSLMLTGCMGGSSGPGALKVEWRVEGATCQKAGIETVRADLYQDGELMYTQDGICSAGSMILEEIDTGRYDVLLSGLDADDLAI